MAKKGDEVISPEGVEERIELEQVFRITLTGGGKYRIYHSNTMVEKMMPGLHPVEVVATLDEAMKIIGMLMVMQGGLIRDPDKIINMVLDSMKKQGL